MSAPVLVVPARKCDKCENEMQVYKVLYKEGTSQIQQVTYMCGCCQGVAYLNERF